MHNFILLFIKIFVIANSMRAMYKGAILGMLSITAVFAGFTFAMNPDVEESPFSDSASIVGHMILTVVDEDNNVIAFRESDNTIVVLGMNNLGANTFSTSTGIPGLGINSGPVTHMDIGSSGTFSTATDVGITALGGACVRDPSGLDSPFVGVDPITGNAQVIIRATCIFAGTTCGGTAIAEAGMFNDVAGGELFARNTFGPVPALGATDTLTIQWNFTFTDT